MKFKKEWLNKNWVSYSIALCIAITFYSIINHFDMILLGLSHIFRFISPVIYGLIIAYILDPGVAFFEKKVFKGKHSRSLSVFTTFILIILALTILGFALIPPIVKSIVGLFSNFDSYSHSLQLWLANLASIANEYNIDISYLTNAGGDALKQIAGMIPRNINNIISTSVNIGVSLFNLVIAFILAIYFLIYASNLQRSLRAFLKAVLKPNKYNAAAEFWRRVNHIFIRYILCDLLDGFIIGCINFLFMTIMHMPFTALVSVIVGVTNLAPTFGPIVGAIIGGFILLLVNPLMAFWFIIFTIILQTFDGYLIKPVLFGDTLGVSSIMILIFIIVGSRMFGVWGILLAIPTAAICDFIYKDFIWRKNLKQMYEQNTEAEL